jgi:hypothetical protein
MGSISEQIQRLEAIKNRLLNLSDAIATAGADLCADIADRVINRGERGEGGKFSPYSTKEVPAFWYMGRSLNAQGEAKVKAKAKAKEGMSYKEFREANNRPTAFKNFSFSQEMWRGFGVKKVEATGGDYTLVIGGQTKESEEKIAWMSGQEKVSIIAPSEEEKRRLIQTLTNKVLNG